MFGYVKPDTPYLYIKDDTLYKSLYCAVCKSIGKRCGQRARLGLTYDIAFMSALIHNVTGVDVKIEKKRCIAHPLISRPVASTDEITDICACINVALAYYKIEDDIIDGNGGNVKKLFFKKGKWKVEKRYPEIGVIIRKRYLELREKEKAQCDGIDEVSEPFAQMMVELGEFAVNGYAGKTLADKSYAGKTLIDKNPTEKNLADKSPTDKNISEKSRRGLDSLLYYLGKWIYLIDALDDYDKDIKEKNYNPIYYSFGKISDFKTLTRSRGEDLSFLFSDIFSGLKEAFSDIEFKFDSALLGNIILRGIPTVTSKTFNKTNKEDKKKNGK